VRKTLIQYISFLTLFFIAANAQAQGFNAQQQASPDIKTANDVDDLDTLKFMQEQWAPELLQVLGQGPRFLPLSAPIKSDPPPMNSSAETRAELDALLEMQKNDRTLETVKQILWEAASKHVALILMAEPTINPMAVIAMQDLIPVTEPDVKYFVMREKAKYMRPRPSILEPDLELVVDNPGHPAYPSGHATQFYLYAKFLSDIDPENAEEYMAFGKAVGRRREIAGVHYESDTKAGHVMGEQLYTELMKVPEVQRQLEKAKEEFERMIQTAARYESGVQDNAAEE